MPEILQFGHLGTRPHTHTHTHREYDGRTCRASNCGQEESHSFSFGNLSPGYTQLAVARVPFDKLSRAKAKTNQLPNIAAHIAHTPRAPPPGTCQAPSAWCTFLFFFVYHLLLLLLLLLFLMYSMSSTPRRPLISCRASRAAHASCLTPTYSAQRALLMLGVISSITGTKRPPAHSSPSLGQRTTAEQRN